MNKLHVYPNNNLGNGVFKTLTFSDFSTSDDIKLVCQKMFSALPTSGVCYRVRMKPTPSGTTADAYVYCASSNCGFVHIRDHGGTDYYGRVQNGAWTWDSYALKSDFNYTDVRITTSANNSIVITGAPKGSEYIPVIVAHKETNNCQGTVVYDGGTWKICSTVSQETTIRFYHMPIS